MSAAVNNSSDGGDIYCWVIGEMSDTNEQVHTVCYGQFTKSLMPPETGWFYIGLYLSKDAESLDRDGKFIYGSLRNASFTNFL